MSTFDDIAQERQRLTERLAKIDGERARVAEQLAELEAAERVLSRFTQARPRSAVKAHLGKTPPGKAQPGKTQTGAAQAGRGRRAAAATAAAPSPQSPRGRRRRATAPPGAALSLGDATLRSVAAHEGALAEEVRNYLANEFGMQVRPNHLGMALQRHRRAGRLEQRDERWYSSRSVEAPAG